MSSVTLPGVTCHVSRAEYEVYTRSRHSAIPPQPSQRPQPGHLSKTSSNLIQFMCYGKIGNHKWKAAAVFKKQSYPGWCIVNGWVWKLQARWRYQAISGMNYVSVWLDKADSVACGYWLHWHGTCRIIIAKQRLNASNCCSLCGLMCMRIKCQCWELLKEIDYEGLKEVSRIAELSHHNIPQSIAAVKRRVWFYHDTF